MESRGYLGTSLLLRRILHVLRTWRASRRVSSLCSDHGALICFADAIPWLFGTSLITSHALFLMYKYIKNRRHRRRIHTARKIQHGMQASRLHLPGCVCMACYFALLRFCYTLSAKMMANDTIDKVRTKQKRRDRYDRV